MPELDPELRPIFEVFAQNAAEIPVLKRGEWEKRRSQMDAGTTEMAKLLPSSENIEVEAFSLKAEDGTMIPLRWYRRADSNSRAAVLYIHGGGKIGGSLDSHDPVCRMYAERADVGVLSVGFRLSPEFPHPMPTEDSYAGLVWLAENAATLGIDLDRIGIAGDSGGGGIAAGIVLMARDRQGPAVAKQFLIYPMLDDRNTVENHAIAPFATWSYDDNYTGWHSFLGDAIGTDTVSAYAAPSRETNLADLPPTFIDVGELDIFRDESIDYAKRLIEAGVSVELHVYPGAPHGFDIIGFSTSLAGNAWDARWRAMNLLNN